VSFQPESFKSHASLVASLSPAKPVCIVDACQKVSLQQDLDLQKSGDKTPSAILGAMRHLPVGRTTGRSFYTIHQRVSSSGLRACAMTARNRAKNIGRQRAVSSERSAFLLSGRCVI